MAKTPATIAVAPLHQTDAATLAPCNPQQDEVGLAFAGGRRTSTEEVE